jgi:hypothetical protein
MLRLQPQDAIAARGQFVRGGEIDDAEQQGDADQEEQPEAQRQAKAADRAYVAEAQPLRGCRDDSLRP